MVNSLLQYQTPIEHRDPSLKNLPRMLVLHLLLRQGQSPSLDRGLDRDVPGRNPGVDIPGLDPGAATPGLNLGVVTPGLDPGDATLGLDPGAVDLGQGVLGREEVVAPPLIEGLVLAVVAPDPGVVEVTAPDPGVDALDPGAVVQDLGATDPDLENVVVPVLRPGTWIVIDNLALQLDLTRDLLPDSRHMNQEGKFL